MVRATISVVALLVGLAALGHHEVRAQPSTDIDAVRTVHESFHEAMSNEDIELMSQIWLHDESIRLIGPNSAEILVGWDAARSAFEESFANVEIVSLSMKDVEVFAGPKLAWIVDIHELQMRPAEDGPQIRATLLATSVYEKVGGRWLLTHHHASPTPQPADQ